MKTPYPISRPAAALSTALLAALLTTTAAYASERASAEPMAVAEAAVQHASTSGTRDNAAAELKIAEDKLASARSAVAARHYERANQLAAEAGVDAQVAELTAQSVRSHKAAQESQDAARALDEELARKATR